MLYYFLLMLLMNLQIKLLNLLVIYVSVIEFSLYALYFVVKFQTIAKILPIYCSGIVIWATLYMDWTYLIVTSSVFCGVLFPYLIVLSVLKLKCIVIIKYIMLYCG